MTLEEAKNLKYHQTVWDQVNRYRNGQPCAWRVNGTPKVWKRKSNAHRVQVPIKYGLWTYGYITENNLDQFSIS